MQNLCRLCGEEKAKEELVIDLNDETSLNVSFKECVEYFCRFRLAAGMILPQRVCQVCKSMVDQCMTFCDAAKIVQKSLLEKVTLNFKDDYVECQQKEQDLYNVVNVEMQNDVRAEADESNYEEFVDYCEKTSVMQFEEELKDGEDMNGEDAMKNYDPKCKRKKNVAPLVPYHINVKKTDTMLDGEVTEIGMKLMMNSKAWNKLSYDCTHCEVIFNSFWELLQHFKKEIADGTERIIKCTDCPKVFSARSSYINHGCSHYESLAFNCIICSKFYYDIPSLRTHYHEVHPKDTQSTYICDFCGKHFVKGAQLKIHILSIHPTSKQAVVNQKIYTYKEKRLQCDQCPKKFASREGLVYHKMIHSGMRPFKCQYCDLYFRSKNNRKLHERTHNRKYSCAICKKEFILKYLMLVHLAKHDDQLVIAEEIK